MKNQQPQRTEDRPSRAADMVTHEGHHVWYDAPQFTTIDIKDIEFATIHMCRYNGHLDWRLVKHLHLGLELSYLYEWTNTDLIRSYYAVHDCHEPYVNDLVAGMKKHVPDYQTLENKWERYVHQELGFPLHESPNPKAVKHLDIRALVSEMTLLGHPGIKVVHSWAAPATDKELMTTWYVKETPLEENWEAVKTHLMREK